MPCSAKRREYVELSSGKAVQAKHPFELVVDGCAQSGEAAEDALRCDVEVWALAPPLGLDARNAVRIELCRLRSRHGGIILSQERFSLA